MNLKSKLFLVLSVLMLLVVFLQPALSVNTSSSNILQPANTNNTFTPTTVGKQSYYILNSGTDYSGATYKNNLPGTFQSSYLGSNNYLTSSPYKFNNKASLYSTQTANSPLTPTNPFLQANTSYNVPNIVQIDNNNSNLLIPETKPFSLHIDQSMTFYAEANKPYVAILTESSNLLLDVNVKNTSIYVNSYLFNFKTNQFDNFNYFYSQRTVPVFNTNNKNDTYIFKFVPGSNTIITVTPHKLSTNDYSSSNVNVNTTASYTVNQGACQDNSKTNENNFDLTSLNSFKFDVTSGTYYQIYLDNSQTDTNNFFCNINNQVGLVFPTLLNSTLDYKHISGYLDSDGFTFQATSNGSMTLFLQNIGYLRRDVSVFFRSISAPAPIKEVPLQLNKDVQLGTHEYNTFTITSPSLLAINQTNALGTSVFPNLSYYTYNTTTQQWDLLTSVSTGSGLYALRPIEGNLVSFNSHNLPYSNWIYIPVGKYAVRTDYNSNDINNYHYTFNVLKINEIGPTGSQTFDVNNNTLVAVQYNRNVFNFNMLNLTSTTHDNVSVSYEVRMVNKYLDYSPSFNPYYTSPFLGNRKTSSGWVQYSVNNTLLYQSIKLSDPDVPIFLIHPYMAENTSSLAQLNSFNTQITVTSQSLTNDTFGYYMIHSSVLSGSETVPINQDYTSSASQVHYFKLNTQSDTLYNLTLIANGNSTNFGSKNISISSYSVYNGAYNDISLPFGSTSSTQIMNTTESSLILTQAGSAYLEVDLSRNYNGSLTIVLNKITSNSLSFPNSINPSTLTWNKTISQFEVHDKNTLFTVIKPSHSTPGFEFLPLLMVLFLIPIYKKHKKID